MHLLEKVVNLKTLQLKQSSQGFYEIKGSKFLSYLVLDIEFVSTLASLKTQHSKAVHFVTASRILQEQLVESFSDDGEPKGSSGVPTLNVLRGENLVNVGVITVRYFGGTLLGVGGLVRAYTQAVQSAIKNAKTQNLLIPYEKKLQWKIEVSYSLLNQIIYLAQSSEVEVIEKEFLMQGVKITLSSNLASKEEFENLCANEAIFLC